MAGLPKLGLGWRSLHIAGLGQPAGPRHSTALNRVGRRTPEWARLNRVEGEDSWRTGPSRTMIQDVPLEFGNVYVPTDNSNGTISQRFVPLLYIRIESNRLHTRFPVHSMVITSDTISHSCGKPSIRPNRFWACEAPPVLRTDLRPNSNSENVSGSEEEKETGIQGSLPPARLGEEDTTMRLSDLSETDKVEIPSTVNIDARFLRGFKLASDTLKSNQDSDS